MFQRRLFPLGPWWHRRTLACQEQAMESQFQTADAQLKETRKPRNVKQYFNAPQKIHPTLTTTTLARTIPQAHLWVISMKKETLCLSSTV